VVTIALGRGKEILEAFDFSGHEVAALKGFSSDLEGIGGGLGEFAPKGRDGSGGRGHVPPCFGQAHVNKLLSRGPNSYACAGLSRLVRLVGQSDTPGENDLSRRVNLHLPDDFVGQIEAQKPKSIALSAFCALLIEQALDAPLPSGMVLESRGGKGGFKPLNSSLRQELEPSKDLQSLEEKKKKGKPIFSNRAISPDLVPDDLLDCQQLLPEFWSVKKGVRSESVWNRICNRLRAWTPEQRREALERAITSGWADVYEPKVNVPAQGSGRMGQKPISELAAEMEAIPSLW
jgi:hypothetical protein